MSLQEARSFTSGDIQQQESNQRSAAHMKIKSDAFSTENRTISQAQQRQTVTSTGVFNQEQKFKQASEHKITKKGISSSGTSMLTSSQRLTAVNGNLMDENMLNSG